MMKLQIRRKYVEMSQEGGSERVSEGGRTRRDINTNYTTQTGTHKTHTHTQRSSISIIILVYILH